MHEVLLQSIHSVETIIHFGLYAFRLTTFLKWAHARCSPHILLKHKKTRQELSLISVENILSYLLCLSEIKKNKKIFFPQVSAVWVFHSNTQHKAQSHHRQRTMNTNDRLTRKMEQHQKFIIFSNLILRANDPLDQRSLPDPL